MRIFKIKLIAKFIDENYIMFFNTKHATLIVIFGKHSENREIEII